nr:reverse transcriptase domain-containing protein [Tanacetum cinerariifolium]
MEIEEEEPEEEPVKEPEPLPGHGDQFDAHPNPQPGNMNGWVDDDDDVEEEEEENMDADIEEDDVAEIIFSYEAEEADDKPEAEDADDELEVEEAGVGPEAEGADVELKAEEPVVYRRPLLGLVPKGRLLYAKIRKMEREILHHDLSGVKETLGKVVDRLKVLEGEENATLRKKLAEKEVLLDLTHMERDRAEKRLSESIWWNKGFYLEMVCKGAVPKPPSDDEGPERPRKTSKKSDGDEGPSDPRESLKIMPPKPMSEARMREIIHDQFATSMNEFMANMNSGAGGPGGASGSGGTGGNADETGVRGTGPTVPELTGCTYATFIKCDPLPFNGTKGAVEEFCPRSMIQRMEQELYNLRMKGMDIDGYINRFHELALLCPRMVEPEAVKEDPKVVTGTFLLNNHFATALFDSGADRSFVSTKFSTLINIKPVEIDTSYEVELADRNIVSTNNILKGCTLNLINHSFPIDLMVIELGIFDIVIGMDWLSKNDAAILCGEKKVRIPLKNKALIIEGDRNQSRLKIISCIKARKYIENGCELFLAQVTETVSKEKRVEDVPVIRDFPKVFLKDLPGLPPPRQVEFRIDPIPGATPVA